MPPAKLFQVTLARPRATWYPRKAEIPRAKVAVTPTRSTAKSGSGLSVGIRNGVDRGSLTYRAVIERLLLRSSWRHSADRYGPNTPAEVLMAYATCPPSTVWNELMVWLLTSSASPK